MKGFYRFIYQCHKWFGLPLALMFIMWYCSGIVMLYHDFPRLLPSNRPVQTVDRGELERLWAELPDTLRSCRITFSGDRLQIATDNDTYGAYHPDIQSLWKIAKSYGTTVQRIDTLTDIDKWIPFNQLMVHLPVYKVVGDDDSFTYVSSQTGEVVQRNTLSGRRWAWIGALPHYVYVTPIRRDVDLWRKVVIWMSGLSTISVIMGIVIAVRFLIKRRKLKIFKKRSWQWHYSWSLFFGLFMLAFIFSGMMSLADIPDWIMRNRELAERPSMAVAKADIDLEKLSHKFGVASLSVNPQMMWTVNSGDDRKIYPASLHGSLNFSSEFMVPVIERQTGEKVTEVSPVREDAFYHADGIEGWKAETDNFTAYWNDEGYFRILDGKSKARHICYRFLHTMQIPGLNSVTWLHTLFMWVLLLGGLVIVGTGTVLSVRTIWRSAPRPNRQ